MRLRVSLLALLVGACTDGTSMPITSGTLPTPARPTAPGNQNGTAPTTDPLGESTAIGVDSLDATTSEPCFVDAAFATPDGFRDAGIGAEVHLEQRVLYSWTTVEQATELAAGGPLLSRMERPGQGPGHAIEYLRDQYYPVSDDDAALKDLLLSEQFARARYAWPYAWATRMGWPATDVGAAESYGNQLIRIVVKPEALWVVLEPGGLRVVNNEGTAVALADPQRIVGIYFVNGRTTGGADCGGSFGANVSAAFREFIVMNPAMVESWELGTETVRRAVEADIQQLGWFFEEVRSCPQLTNAEQWAADIVCSDWDRVGTSAGDYAMHLALLNSYYIPRAAEVAAIIQTLSDDLTAWEIRAEAPSTSGPDGGVMPEPDAGSGETETGPVESHHGSNSNSSAAESDGSAAASSASGDTGGSP